MQKLLILLNLLILFTAATAQTAANSNIQQYTTDNGLPSNGIKGMQWDEETGFLWMATEAGIVRFNGVDFKSYTKENTPVISSERMLFIRQNHAGSIYVSDQVGNIFRINKGKPVLWRKAAVNNTNNPQLNGYYLLSVSDSFFRKNVGRISIPTGILAGYSQITCINDTTYLVLSGNTVYLHSISMEKPVGLHFEEKNIDNIFKINKDVFVVNRQGNFLLMNTANGSFSPVEINRNADDGPEIRTGKPLIFWQTGMDKPLLIEDGKVWMLNFDGGTIHAKLIFSGITEDVFIRSLQYSEKNGLLFIGTESKGLIVIRPNKVLSKKRKDANLTNRNSYYSQVALDDGNI
ncbi:MAG TPA: hypothetical protein VHL77_09625, partial [Ferruginibacter sp.]|nr:hypothetical protein [Ferruginibacter sp.]